MQLLWRSITTFLNQLDFLVPYLTNQLSYLLNVGQNDIVLVHVPGLISCHLFRSRLFSYIRKELFQLMFENKISLILENQNAFIPLITVLPQNCIHVTYIVTIWFRKFGLFSNCPQMFPRVFNPDRRLGRNFFQAQVGLNIGRYCMKLKKFQLSILV